MIDYDPTKHKGLPLYEVQTAKGKSGDLAVVYVLAEERMRVYADRFPYNFMIDESDIISKKQIIIKGGPGSGHRGHAGRPGKVGGSVPGTDIGGALSIRTGKDRELRQRIAAGKLEKGDKLDFSSTMNSGPVTVVEVDMYQGTEYYRLEFDDGAKYWAAPSEIQHGGEPIGITSEPEYLTVPSGDPDTTGYLVLGKLSAAEGYDDHFNEWRKDLSPQEEDAIEYYTGSGYNEVSDWLRGGEAPWGDVRAKVYHLDDALSRASMPENTLVYRGINFDHYIGLSTGDTFTDKSFVSTSMSFEKASDWANGKAGGNGGVITIKLPRGSTAASVMSISQHHSEQEVLLPRSSYFSVDAINPMTNEITVTFISSDVYAAKD